MEHVRMGDNNSCAHPTENPAPPLIQPDPSLLTPNRNDEYPASPSPPPRTANSHHTNKPRFLRLKPRRPKPLFQGFEAPRFSCIAILTVLCLITYPAFHLLTLVAKGKSLFVVRIIVSLWCSGIGFALGYILLKIGARHLEAATWATVIHMGQGGGGMKLRDLARGSSDPTSFVPAFHILRSRFRNREASRSSRKPYDKRPWTMFLGFFVILAILAPLLPFLFGRIIEIEIFIRNRRTEYHEVLIAGDLSQEDVREAIAQLMTTGSYGGGTSDTVELVYNNETVYFAQPSLSQFVPGGSGLGTFTPAPIVLRVQPNNNPATSRNAPKSDTGAVLRYPQWGIRIHCEKLPAPEVNLVPLSNNNNTYTFIPRDFIRGLLGFYGMDLPMELMEPMLDGNDTIPSNINTSEIYFVADFEGHGEGIGVYTDWRSRQYQAHQELTVVEAILLRFDTRHTPSGRFPVYSDKTGYGYDAAMCVQKYEPWVVETQNTSIASPSALRIIERGNCNTSLPPSGNIHGARISNTRCLDSTGKELAFELGFDDARRVISGFEESGPSPIAVSMTDGIGQWGYTELSPDRLATTRARIGAACTLPYFVGSGPVVAQSYRDQTLAYTTYKWWRLIGLPIVIWLLGMIGELFVPMLPLHIPRREFGIYSWLALFKSQELQFEGVDDLHKFMNLGELEEIFLDERVKLVA